MFFQQPCRFFALLTLAVLAASSQAEAQDTALLGWPGEASELASDDSRGSTILAPADCEVIGCSCCEGVDCSDGVSDCCTGTCKKKAAAKPSPCATSHKDLFYANDFSYLNAPCYKGSCLGDSLKLLPVGRCGRLGTLDVGGQLRLRYHHEVGMGQVAGNTRFQDTENDFMLTRLRLYTNWRMSDDIRFYCEGILSDVTDDAVYVPRGIDINYGDLLNLFMDVRLTENTTVRVGRQEMLYGVHRTVSPLDWANTRRTFDGVKVMYKNCDWAIDAFYTGLVNVDPHDFDNGDYQQDFYGVYSVYSGLDSATVDLYYLGYDNEHTGGAPGTDDFSLHTLGARLSGSRGDWLYEIEGGPQFGRQSAVRGGVNHSAGFVTAGIGRKLDMAWSPTLWVYYDYASGDDGNGDFNRYNQLFPLAHKYLGFIDATQRSNIESPNVLLTMNPHKKVSLLLWYYHMMADRAQDIVPSIGGTPAQSTTSTDWGDELDFIVKYSFRPRSNILFGYSHFWAGNKITPPGGAVDADFFYTQWELNF